MLQAIDSATIKELTAQRAGELRFGDTIEVLPNLNQLHSQKPAFVVLGICEDIGIRANLGFAGAANAWDYFLPAFLNVQNNIFLEGSRFALAGKLEFPDLMKEAQSLNPSSESDLQRLREMTAEIDNSVKMVIEQIVKANKIPVVIGGGHNNAFGNIAGTSAALKQKINVLNIDPHADYRALEGRHSGNGFRYAKEAEFLAKYAVFGLHEGYNNQEMLELFHERADLYYLSFDELLTFSTQERDKLFKDVLNWLGHDAMGLEVDMDSVTDFPVSAMNPSGLSMRQLRLLVMTAAALAHPRYLHLCEASPGRAQNEIQKQMLGKSLAYLVCDFAKAMKA